MVTYSLRVSHWGGGMGEDLGLLEGKLLEEELELEELLFSGQQWVSEIFLKVFGYTRSCVTWQTIWRGQVLIAVLDSDAEGTSPGCGNVRFLNSWKKLLKAAGNFTDSGGVLVVGNNRNALVEATIKHAHALPHSCGCHGTEPTETVPMIKIFGAGR